MIEREYTQKDEKRLKVPRNDFKIAYSIKIRSFTHSE